MPKFKDLKEQLLKKVTDRKGSAEIKAPESDKTVTKSKNLSLDITKLY